MLKWDPDSPTTFAPGKTLRDYDRRFAMEEDGRVQTGRKFRWADVLPKEVLESDAAGIHRP